MNGKTQVFEEETERRNKRRLNHTRALYFGYYLAIGAFIPYINLYYERMGLSGVQIGTLSALTVLVGSLAALILGGIADMYNWHNRILRFAFLLCTLSVLILAQASSFYSLIAIVIFYAIFNSPIIPILDSSALVSVKSNGTSYGKLRLWGTIGWAISTLLVGMLIDNFDILWLFYSYIAFMLFTFLLSLIQRTRISHLKTSFAPGLHRLVRAYFFIFLLAIFLVSMTSSAFHSFFSIYLDGIGADERFIGIAWMIAAVSEIPIMLGSGYMIQRFSAGGLLKISFIAYALRWLLLSFITVPQWVIVVQLLHGLSFAAFLVGGVTYINQLVPASLITTGQAIFTSVSFGLASIIGSLVAGYFFDTWGLTALFRVLSIIAFIGLFVFYLSELSLAKTTSATAST